MRSERRSTSTLKKVITGILSIIVLALQIILYYGMFFYLEKVQAIEIVLNILAIICVLYLYQKDLNIGYKLTWTIAILIFPLIGIFLYLLLGNGRTIPKRRAVKIDNYLRDKLTIDSDIAKCEKQVDPIGYKLINSVQNTSFYPVYFNSKGTVFYNDASKKHSALMEAIYKAQKYIFLEYFIIADGSLMNEIAEALEVKGRQGIEIKFIYDDVGSILGHKENIVKRLEKIPNLQIHPYEPLGFNYNPAVNYRDHRKIAVIDGKIAFVGGDNLADEYVHRKERFGFWRDNSIKIEGNAVKSFVVMFLEMWYMSCKEMLDVDLYKYEENEISSPSLILPFGDGPTNQANPAYNLFSTMISSANKYIYISTPYLIIDQNFITLISRAALEGIDVRILTPAIPDKKSVFQITRAHYKSILKAGGKIYEYSPGFNHAKNVIVDDEYAFVGTVNIDYRSLFLHFECGTLLLHDPETEKIKKDFLNACSVSKEITYEEYKKRPFIDKVIQFILQIFAPVL